jgi:DNA-directed RNA polymerase specialized sigma24 family protein
LTLMVNAKTAWRLSLTLPHSFEELDAMTGAEAEVLAPLNMVTTLAHAAAQLDAKLHDVVSWARLRGHSWTEIGDALGVSKQAAWNRFSSED